MTPQEKDAMHLMATEYARMGLYGFPLHGVEDDLTCTCGKGECSDRGKHPRTTRGLKDATLDVAQIHRWIYESGWDNLNWAIVTGEISNVTVLDIDTGPGKVGAESWAEIIREHGEPETLRAITGSGGSHLFFLYNSALKTASNVLGKHIDCRNDRGYVVATPSRHKSGGVYQWENWGTALAPLPAHLSQRKETRGRHRKDDPTRRTSYSLEEVRRMLEFVPADDRDMWRSVGVILGRVFERSEQAWEVYVEWAGKWDGLKGRNHDEIMREAFHETSQHSAERELSLGTIVKAAIDNGWVPTKGEVSIEQFVYDHESNGYIYRPSGAVWVAASVDAACGEVNEGGKLIKASLWIQQHARITTTTSTPAIKGDVLKGYDCREGALFESPGGAVFNRYRPPTIELGDPALAEKFEQHIRNLMPHEGDADQFMDYMAHRVQKPEEKPRFSLLMVGDQGVGKDTGLDFCTPAIGVWNVKNISPSAVEGSFNEYATGTLIRINEAADLREMSRWAFNERIKVLIAGNPDVCEINPKYGRKFTVTMHCGVTITTNHLTGSVHIPADDRRYDVIQCATLEEMGLADDKVRRDYFTELWEWFLEKDGARHVAAFLHERDLSGFSAALGQRKTAAHQEVVRSGMVGDEWARDIVDGLGNPDVLNGNWILDRAVGMGERKADVRARMGHALRRMGYEVIRNLNYQDGRWKLNGVLCRVYKRRDYTPDTGTDWQKVLEIPRS